MEIRSALGDEFEPLRSFGAAMTVEQAVAYALNLETSNIGRLGAS